MTTGRHSTFFTVLSAAIADITEHGFDTQGRIDYWTHELREAAVSSLMPLHKMDHMLRLGLGSIYRRLVEKGQIARYHRGIDRYTLDRIKPYLRAELDRRIMASANLIKLNRQQAIDKTLQRFQGWSTSIPAGGSTTTARRETGKEVRKALAQLPFQERRVIIDQGHRLTASINLVVAEDGGAIALIWHSHFRQTGYNFREEHRERDGKVYLIRNSWAQKSGLVKIGEAGYYDEVTAVAQEINCRCYAEFLYTVSSLPPDMLTEKGRQSLERVRESAA